VPRLVTLLLAAALAACGGGDGEPSSSATGAAAPVKPATRPRWDPRALATARALADRIRDAGVACDGYEPWNRALIAKDYHDKLPLPDAMAACTGPAGEDLTFEVFADGARRDDFLVAKMRLVCTTAKARRLGFPGLPFVEGDAWVIEPDEEATADKLAEILGAASKLATCPETPATSAR
jgi:hypothetical protein